MSLPLADVASISHSQLCWVHLGENWWSWIDGGTWLKTFASHKKIWGKNILGLFFFWQNFETDSQSGIPPVASGLQQMLKPFIVSTKGSMVFAVILGGHFVLNDTMDHCSLEKRKVSQSCNMSSFYFAWAQKRRKAGKFHAADNGFYDSVLPLE